MSTEVQTTNGTTFAPTMTSKQHAEMFTELVLKNDLSKLTEPQRVEYYKLVCERSGLDPTTTPFNLISLSGKLTLYANKTAIAQLTKIHKLRVTITKDAVLNGLFVATARAEMPNGSCSEDIGVVTLGGLQGDAAGNAMMKAVTKAKRRAVLSVCGLGMLDETEVDTIPGAEIVDVPKAAIAPPANEEEREAIDMWRDTLEACEDVDTLNNIIADIRKAKQAVRDAIGPAVATKANALGVVWKAGTGYVAQVRA